jgi:hypothetical protein
MKRPYVIILLALICAGVVAQAKLTRLQANDALATASANQAMQTVASLPHEETPAAPPETIPPPAPVAPAPVAPAPVPAPVLPVPPPPAKLETDAGVQKAEAEAKANANAELISGLVKKLEALIANEQVEPKEPQEPDVPEVAAPADAPNSDNTVIEVSVGKPGEAEEVAKADQGSGDQGSGDQESGDQGSGDQTKISPLLDEVGKLREEVLRLQQTFDIYSGNELAELKAENERLRKEIGQLGESKPASTMNVPSPNRELIRQIIEQKEAGDTGKPERTNTAALQSDDANKAIEEPSEASAQQIITTPRKKADADEPQTPPAEGEASSPGDGSGSTGDLVLKEIARWKKEREEKKAGLKPANAVRVESPARERDEKTAQAEKPKQEEQPAEPIVTRDGYQVVAEWGRTPDEAKAMSKPDISLKGMICVVKPETDDDRLAEMGRKLRAQNAEYANLNIEVFDDQDAAVQFKKGGAPSGHRVLSVSKHAASERDVVLLVRGGQTREVPLEAAGKPAAQ